MVAAAQPALFVQDDLADLHPGEVTGAKWTAVPAADVSARFCTASVSALALTSRALTRHERDHCAALGHGRLVETLIGRRAVLAMTLGTSFGLTGSLLYRALAHDVPDVSGRLVSNSVTRWRELDPALPDELIRVLVPPTGSAESRIVSDVVLYEGCSSVAGPMLPFNADERLSQCTTLRTDAVVAHPTNRSVSAWLHDQGRAAVALIGVATLLAEPDLETAMPLDGVIPSFATIADGSYRAVTPVWLLAILSPGSRQVIATVTNSLLSESSIGSLGKLPQRGLAPLAAADRIALRSTIGRAVEYAVH